MTTSHAPQQALHISEAIASAGKRPSLATLLGNDPLAAHSTGHACWYATSNFIVRDDALRKPTLAQFIKHRNKTEDRPANVWKWRDASLGGILADLLRRDTTDPRDPQVEAYAPRIGITVGGAGDTEAKVILCKPDKDNLLPTLGIDRRFYRFLCYHLLGAAKMVQLRAPTAQPFAILDRDSRPIAFCMPANIGPYAGRSYVLEEVQA